MDGFLVFKIRFCPGGAGFRTGRNHLKEPVQFLVEKMVVVWTGFAVRRVFLKSINTPRTDLRGAGQRTGFASVADCYSECRNRCRIMFQ